MPAKFIVQTSVGSDILLLISELENAIKEKDAVKLAEIILAGFQLLDEDLKAENQ